MPEKIGLQAVLEDKEFRAGLQRYLSGIDEMESGNKEMAASVEKSGKSFDVLGEDMKGAEKSSLDLAAQMYVVKEAMDVVAEVVGAGLELAELGASAERVEERFGLFAEEAGGATEILEAFQIGAGGTVAEMEAMESASRLLQMGLVTSGDEMETVVEMATRLGDQTMSAKDRVSDFALMLANQSIPRLDNFGIASGKVRERMLELTTQMGMARDEAFKMAVFEEGGLSLEILGERTEDTAAKFEIMEARMADARVELGKKFANVASEALDVIGDVSDEALMAFAAFQDFGGALVKIGPALGGFMPVLGKLPGAFKTLNSAMGATKVATAGLLAGSTLLIAGLVLIVKKIIDYQQEMREAWAAARQWREEIEKEVNSGILLDKSLRDRARIINETTKATWEASEATKGWESFLRQKDEIILKGTGHEKEALIQIYETRSAIIAYAESMGDANRMIEIVNGQIENTAFHIPLLTEEVYGSVVAFQDLVLPIEAAALVYDDLVRVMADGELATRFLADETFYLTDEMYDQVQAAEGYDRAMLNVVSAVEEGVLITDDYEAAVRREAKATEDSARAADEAKRAQEEQTRQLEELARAQEAARLAAIDHVSSQLSLMEQLSGTISKQELAHEALDRIRQLAVEGVIPSEEKMEAISLKVMEAFGLVDEKGRFLYEGLGLIDEAMGTGEIDTGDYKDVLLKLFDLYKQRHPDIDDFKQVLIDTEGPLDRDREKTELLNKAVEAGEDPFLKGTEAAEGMKKVTEDSAQPTEDLTGKEGDLTGALEGLPGPLEEATGGVGDFTESVIETQTPMDEFIERVGTMAEQVRDLAPGMRSAGVALVAALREGFEAEWARLEAEKKRRLAIFRGEFPGSEPEDTTSPLYNLSEAGRAIVRNITDGIWDEAETFYEAARSVFDLAGILSGLGQSAAAIFQKDVLDPLKEELRGIDIETRDIAKLLGIRGRFETPAELAAMVQMEMRKLGLITDPSRGTQRRLRELAAMYRLLLGLEDRRGEAAEEYAKQQERILRLQEAQQRLQFLQQQIRLLELVEEHGLNLEDILGDLKLGVDADMADVLDAMARAIEQIIKEVEERLGAKSPSKVFMDIGKNMMRGMAFGIEDLAALPVQQSVIAAQATASAPATAFGAGGGSVDNSRTVNVHAGRNTINNATEGAIFEERVRRAVAAGIRGYK